MTKLHLHTYKLVKKIQLISPFSSTYEDWACIHEGCHHILRRKLLNPPKRRIVEEDVANSDRSTGDRKVALCETKESEEEAVS